MLYKSKFDYRPASSSGAVREDNLCANDQAGMYIVVDGVSGPYSPSNPKLMYGKRTGGQMVGDTINHIMTHAGANERIQDVLRLANDIACLRHSHEGENPEKAAVAGACVAACQVNQVTATLLAIGDCFVFYRNTRGVSSLTNFDLAAYNFEKKGDEAFQMCLDAADAEFPETKGKNIGKAWDKYYPYFCDKQFKRANRNLGDGGHAMLNGDPALPDCWTEKQISLKGLQWILLCTDGMLPPHMTQPAQHWDLARSISDVYENQGLSRIGEWRNKAVADHEAETKNSDMPHIEGHPEGSIIAVKFST